MSQECPNYCPRCGLDLRRSLTREMCPECHVDALRLPDGYGPTLWHKEGCSKPKTITEKVSPEYFMPFQEKKKG